MTKSQLEKAEEISRKQYKAYKHSDKSWIVMNKFDEYENKDWFYFGEWFDYEKASKLRDWLNRYIKQEAKKLKVGCGEYINVRLGIVCGNKNYNNPLCDDCQRIKEIKERIEG